MLKNYDLKYKTKGRFIFVPTDESVRVGKRIIDKCLKTVELPSYCYHYTSGGHVAALHAHIRSEYFYRLDVQNFFYSIRRNRVARTLRRFGIRGAREKAQWSCVRSPYSDEEYVLPIGFVQSPILASLVIMDSPIAQAIESAKSRSVFTSMYFDDFIGSSDDLKSLQISFDEMTKAFTASNLTVNAEKTIEPTKTITAFNCAVRKGFAEVTSERIAKFEAKLLSPAATLAFGAYCQRVSSMNLE